MLRRPFIAACAALALAACASTSIVNHWEASDAGPAFEKLLVVGITHNASMRRIFEDEFVRALASHGLAGVQSYTLIPEDGPVDDDRLNAAIGQSSADGVLAVRVIAVTQQINVTPASPGFHSRPWDFHGFYRGAWGRAYTFPPRVTTNDIVYAEARLYRTASDTLVWAATTRTFAPTNVRAESAAFADLIARQLSQRDLI
jgi:hypothetical protein